MGEWLTSLVWTGLSHSSSQRRKLYPQHGCWSGFEGVGRTLGISGVCCPDLAGLDTGWDLQMDSPDAAQIQRVHPDSGRLSGSLSGLVGLQGTFTATLWLLWLTVKSNRG
jgi:hypothetical protein